MDCVGILECAPITEASFHTSRLMHLLAQKEAEFVWMGKIMSDL